MTDNFLKETPMENIFTSRKLTQFENDGEWIMPFGKLKGVKIGSVNTKYIKFCLENFENFTYSDQFKSELLRRYKK